MGFFFLQRYELQNILVAYHFYDKIYVSYLKVKHCRAIDLHTFKYDLVDCTVPVDRRSHYSAILCNHLHCSSLFFFQFDSRLDTDILFAKNCGMRSTLVLSGCSSIDDIHQPADAAGAAGTQPDFYTENLAGLGIFI